MPSDNRMKIKRKKKNWQWTKNVCAFFPRGTNQRKKPEKGIWMFGRCCEVIEDAQVGSLPSGSTCLAKFKASEVARSVLAGVTAKIRQVSFVTNCMSMSLIWVSMSWGWSPTGILVIPGRSINVMLRTEKQGRFWTNSAVTAWTLYQQFHLKNCPRQTRICSFQLFLPPSVLGSRFQRFKITIRIYSSCQL